MGEIADMMIDGTMCPCGEFIDGGADGPGFTQYCSTQCQLDYGGPVEIDSTVKPPRTVLCREHPHCSADSEPREQKDNTGLISMTLPEIDHGNDSSNDKH